MSLEIILEFVVLKSDWGVDNENIRHNIDYVIKIITLFFCSLNND